MPGMIDEPGCTAGSAISPSPVRGPGAEQAQVVRDLDEVERERAQRRGDVREVGHRLCDGDQVRRGTQVKFRISIATFAA